MNIDQLSELDPYWIVERYDGAKTMAQFVDCLHEYGVPRGGGVLIWKIIDATVDMRIDGCRVAESSGAVGSKHVPPTRKGMLRKGLQ